MATEADLLGTFEVHSPDDLESILAAGIRADQRKKTVDCLIEGYLRSARFTDCLRIMLTSGAEVGDPFLKRVCSMTPWALKTQIAASSTILTRRFTLLTAFT